MVFLEARAVKAGRGVCCPSDLEGSGKQGFFVAHDGLDFIFHASDFRFQFFLQAFEFQKFLNLGFEVRVRRCGFPPFVLLRCFPQPCNYIILRLAYIVKRFA